MGGRGRAVLWGLSLTLLVAALHLGRPSLLEIADNRIYDLLLASVHSGTTSGVPVIVDIDEASLREFGQWPWPRYRVAWLLEAILESGARSVGVDLLFPEPDRTSLLRLREELKRDLELNLELPASIPSDNDRVLAAALENRPFVMGFKFLFEPAESSSLGDCLGKPLRAALLRVAEEDAAEPNFFRALDQVCNIPVLAKATTASGFLNAAPDADGVLRRVPALMEREGMIYPSLGLAAVIQADGAPASTLKLGEVGGDVLRFGERAVRLGERGTLLVHFRGAKRDFPYLSAGEILSGRSDPKALLGKIVFLGSSAAGLEDLSATPLSPTFPGVEIHATLADNILRGDTLRRPPWAPLLELVALVLLGVASSLFFPRQSAAVGLAVALAAAFALATGSAASLRGWGIFVSPLFPALALGAVFSLSNLLRLRAKEREVRQRARELAQMQKASIRSLAALSETRDPDSGQHIARTQRYVRLLAERLADHPRFKAFLSRVPAEVLAEMVALHDIGKVGVPDRILLKPDKLTEAEFETMKRHTVLGREALRVAERDLKDHNSFFEPARNLVYSHHERWDGSGYPEGLRGEQIPVEGRIMAVADVYDALVSRRVYKPAFTHEAALRIMKQGRGSHFDPAVLDAFLQLEAEFAEVARAHPDEPA